MWRRCKDMRKILWILLIALLLTGCKTGGTQAETETPVPSVPETQVTVATENVSTLSHNGKQWELTFQDEFSGTKLDFHKWEYLPVQIRDTCIWTPGAVSMEDGCLILNVEAGEEPYHAGAIRSMGRFEQAYGYFEIRCKVPSIPGVNAAFWLIGGSMWTQEAEGGMDGAEIDVLETNALSQTTFQHAVHWDGYGEYHDSVNHPVPNKRIYDGNFHVFGFEWTKDEYIFYVDGDETWRTNAGGICTVPLYLKLTAATGGWVGDPDPGNLPTQAMVIDYVRVYKEA